MIHKMRFAFICKGWNFSLVSRLRYRRLLPFGDEASITSLEDYFGKTGKTKFYIKSTKVTLNGCNFIQNRNSFSIYKCLKIYGIK